ncbi:CitMHS family transporter [Methylobacterium isbiliense]|uniref:Citrate transporter n=1 Tax=Methylobacterium isbiliense TaxID=315478 RepID=A0ABQ4SIY7_9HYPH|nr:citrate:proton symporter [Methylobacterium isbiliense]MDN3623673.1 citrate:proton symporter [Methylobacterium isbiliense]GJE03097.1 Citrate transporter [Methylobacterium isbiliense]
MLAVLGFATIAAFLYAIMTKRLSVLVALILIPAIAGLLAGAGPGLGKMMLDGIGRVAPVGVMIIFAVLYFGLMLDVGLFDPMIRRLLRLVKGDPIKVALATAVLTMAVALDGDGATTFLITVSAMLPLYQRLGMNRLVLSGIVALGAGVMNIIPWGGPTVRAMAALKADASALFNPVVPAMAVGIVWVLVVAYILGRRERTRLGLAGRPGGTAAPQPASLSAASNPVADLPQDGDDLVPAAEGKVALERPWLFWFNAVLTVVLVVALLMTWLPLPVLFILAFAVALPVNYPSWEQQQKHLVAHAASVVTVSTMIFAAGIFTGVLTGTKMIDAMAAAAVSVIPPSLAGYLPVIVAVTSMPLSLVFTPDAYYFGVLPVLAQSAASLGVDPVLVGRGAILGQMTTGFPLSPLTASTFILIGLCGVNLGDHQRFIFPWAFGTTLVMTAVAFATGVLG